MKVSYSRCGFVLGAATLLLTGACSREGEQISTTTESATEEVTSAINKEIWVDDVQLSSTTGGAAQDGFTAGQTLQLSMSVDDAPPGTLITTYWYGPNNRQLSYESQTVDANERQLNFPQENTHGWAEGTYRAEVWIGDDKVKEESFRIVSG